MACSSSVIVGSQNSDEDPFQDSGSEYVPSETGNEIFEQRNESTGSDSEAEKQSRGKKRIRNESKWKRNVAKKKRNAGQEYINRCKRVVPAKNFLEVEDCCESHCWEKINPQRQQAIFTLFYTIETFDLQSAYIFALVEVVNKLRTYTERAGASRREKTRIYFLHNDAGEKIKVCKFFFKKVLQVSDGRISRVLANKKEGSAAPVDGRGKGTSINKTPDVKVQSVIQFIEKFPAYESHYTRRKNPHRKYLAPDLSLGKMYELYKQEKELENVTPVSMFIFREIFLKKINLCFHAPIKDSCKKCDLFENKIKFSTDDAEKQQSQIERDLHHRKATSARDGMKRDGDFAKTNPEEVTAIAFDLMKTLPTPVISTGICYYKRQLWTYCLGIHNLGTNEVFMYTWDESVASRGPQEVGSCIFHFVKNYVSTEKLIMYSDQCGGQNRNFKMAALCSYIVSSELSTVNEINHKFLVSGHSFLPCDQDFGLVEKQKKFFRDIFIPNDWRKVVESSRKRLPFKVIKMSASDFYSTAKLEQNLTNRKISANKSKIEWLKIQWLLYKKSEPFCIFYKYSNNEDALFDSFSVEKRRSIQTLESIELSLLYPKGRNIDVKKKKDLLELIPFIPPVHHDFYKNLKTSENTSEEIFSEGEEEEENRDEVQEDV